MRSVSGSASEPNSFLILYLLPAVTLPVLCSSGPVRSVAFFPGKTLGGFHISLTEGHRAILSPLLGYFDCGGHKGFLWPSAEEQEVLKYRISPGSHGKLYVAFDFGGHPFDRSQYLRMQMGKAFPIRKEVPFIELRHGILYARTDFGSFYRKASMDVYWPDRLTGGIRHGWKVAVLAYSSAHVRCQSLSASRERRLMEPEIATGEFPQVRLRGNPIRCSSMPDSLLSEKECR